MRRKTWKNKRGRDGKKRSNWKKPKKKKNDNGKQTCRVETKVKTEFLTQSHVILSAGLILIFSHHQHYHRQLLLDSKLNHNVGSSVRSTLPFQRFQIRRLRFVGSVFALCFYISAPASSRKPPLRPASHQALFAPQKLEIVYPGLRRLIFSHQKPSNPLSTLVIYADSPTQKCFATFRLKWWFMKDAWRQ